MLPIAATERSVGLTPISIDTSPTAAISTVRAKKVLDVFESMIQWPVMPFNMDAEEERMMPASAQTRRRGILTLHIMRAMPDPPGEKIETKASMADIFGAPMRIKRKEKTTIITIRTEISGSLFVNLLIFI